MSTGTRRPARKKPATISDIARELGVSPMTVSRALNNHPAVKDETREKVLETARRLGYRANRWARSLVTRRTQVVGIVIPDITHSFFSDITRGVQDSVERDGYGLMLCNSNEDVGRERQQIDMLVGARVDGLVVASRLPEDSPDIYEDLLRQQLPFVLIDRYFPKLAAPYVVVDDYRVGELAAQHLVKLGHRRIGHIAGPPVSTTRARRAGFQSVLDAAGIAASDQSIEESDYSYDAGIQATIRLLKRNAPPTAIFAGNGRTAVAAIDACRHLGKAVPGDVSVVGAGNVEGPHSPSPFLTIVDWPRYELGQIAGEALLTGIEGRPDPGGPGHVLAPTLVIHESTASPASACQAVSF